MSFMVHGATARSARRRVGGGAWRSLKGYVGSLRENQTAIYHLVGDDMARLGTSPHLEGFSVG
jgi:molecular chaperone HtpG